MSDSDYQAGMTAAIQAYQASVAVPSDRLLIHVHASTVRRSTTETVTVSL